MSKAASPTHFSEEMNHAYDSNFSSDITQKMKVPRRIKVDGEADDGMPTAKWDNMYSNEKFDMHVPDRILVVGQEQHVGTKVPPRELVLETAVMPPDSGIRVQTPPRVITLDSHYFPSADDFPPQPDLPKEPITAAVVPIKSRVSRESTPPIMAGEGLTPSEEIIHLRRQMAKLNRRVMAVELDNLQRQQREKIIYAIGLAYFFFKTVFWLARSS